MSDWAQIRDRWSNEACLRPGLDPLGVMRKARIKKGVVAAVTTAPKRLHQMDDTRNARERQPCPARQAALDYARRGWRVVPLWRPRNGVCSCRKGKACDRAGKHPRLAHGHQGATTDPKRIATWKWESANVGVATGSESGLLVVDIDPRSGGCEHLAELEARLGKLPAGPRVKTGGGGAHRWFRHPGGHIKSRTVAPGVDIKADDGLVVAPPSTHQSGGVYLWEEAPTGAALPELPEKWLRWIQSGCYTSYPSYSSELSQSQLVLARGRQQVDDGCFLPLDNYVEEAIRGTLPPDIGWRRKCLWYFLLKLKRHPDLRGKPVIATRTYVQRWHKRALPTIGTKPFTHTWDDAVGAWDRINPEYESEMGAIVQRAFTSEPPTLVAELDYADDPVTVALVCLFREMQRARGEEPFWISCEKAAQVISEKVARTNRMTIARRIKMLIADLVVDRVSVGRREDNKSSEYRYLYPLYETSER